MKGRDLGVGGRIILKWILKEIKYDDLDWIYVVKIRDHLPAIVNTNFLKMRGI
jgi:hypothetical protein